MQLASCSRTHRADFLNDRVCAGGQTKLLRLQAARQGALACGAGFSAARGRACTSMMTMTGSGVYVVIISWMSRSHCSGAKPCQLLPLLARAAWSARERASRILGPVLYQPTTASLAASPGRDGRSAGRTSQKGAQGTHR